MWVIGPDASAEASYDDFQAALAAYRRANPFRRVEAEAFPAEGYGERLSAALAAHGGPDVFASYGGFRLRTLAADGRVLALDPYLDEPARSLLPPALRDEFLFDGRTFGLPFGAHAAALLYNRSVLNGYGLAAPAGFDGLLGLVGTLRNLGVLPFALGNRERWPAALFFETLAARRAGSAEAVRQRVLAGRFEDPAFLAAAEDVKRLVDAGAFRSDAADLSMFTEGLADFREGRAAMMYHGSWLAGALEDGPSPVRGAVEAAAFPGAPALWGGAFAGLCVNAESARPAEAAEFARDLSRLQDGIAWRSGTSLPVYRDSMEGDATGTDLSRGIAALLRKSDALAPNWDLLLEEKAEQRYLDAVAALLRGTLTPQRFAASLGR